MKTLVGAGIRLHAGPRSWSRQVEDGRRTAQLFLPVAPESFAFSAGEHLRLALRIVEISGAERRQICARAISLCFVDRPQLVDEQREGPEVDDHVMCDEQ